MAVCSCANSRSHIKECSIIDSQPQTMALNCLFQHTATKLHILSLSQVVSYFVLLEMSDDGHEDLILVWPVDQVSAGLFYPYFHNQGTATAYDASTCWHKQHKASHFLRVVQRV